MKHEINQYINEIENDLKEYKPSEKVLLELGQRSIVMFSGPFAVGKTTIAKSIESVSCDVSRTKSFTTRPCRDENERENYRFLEHSTKNLEEIISKIKHQDLVQGMVHPTTGYIYMVPKYSIMDQERHLYWM